MSNLRQTLAGLSGRQFLVAIPGAGLVLGLALSWAGQATVAGFVWAAFTAPVLLLLLFDIVMSLRRGEIDDARQPRTNRCGAFFVMG